MLRRPTQQQFSELNYSCTHISSHNEPAPIANQPNDMFAVGATLAATENSVATEVAVVAETVWLVRDRRLTGDVITSVC